MFFNSLVRACEPSPSPSQMAACRLLLHMGSGAVGTARGEYSGTKSSWSCQIISEVCNVNMWTSRTESHNVQTQTCIHTYTFSHTRRESSGLILVSRVGGWGVFLQTTALFQYYSERHWELDKSQRRPNLSFSSSRGLRSTAAGLISHNTGAHPI